MLSSVSAIIIGLLAGSAILLICNPSQALPKFVTILIGVSTYGLKGVRQVFCYAIPIILTSLSIDFTSKTDLFSIDTSGQFTVGVFAAACVGVIWTGLGRVQQAVVLLAVTLDGTLWGMVPGSLKTCFNVNEAIASIVISYVGMYMVNWAVKSYKPLLNSLRNESRNVAVTAQIPKTGTDKLFPESGVGGGILLVIAAVSIIWVILNKTTFDYELKTVGFDRDTNRCVGINEKGNIIVNMIIAGAMAGMAGGFLHLVGTDKHIEIKDVLVSRGLIGISVVLLGLSHPVGVLFSGLFTAYLAAEGLYLQLFEFPTETIDITVTAIIYFNTLALVVKTILAWMNRKQEKESGQT